MSYSAIDVVLRLANAMTFVREEPRNSNRGQAVERFLKETGLGPGYPWCAAYVAWVGRMALGAATWPLPNVAGCMSLFDAGKQKGMVRTAPVRGDVFLIYSPSLRRFAHTGFVGAVAGSVAETFEGNTNDGGSRDGWGVFRRERTFGPEDRFLRWTESF